jgi:glycosyltransferase involved in cell wall biosynthesis
VRLLLAFAGLNSDIKLIIAGSCKDPQYLNEIRKTASDSELKSHFEYLDYVSDDDLPYLYNGARAFVLPSLHEGFGVPIVEAMACGTPVITSNCSAMPEIAGGAALLVNPISVEQIAYALEQIVSDDAVRLCLRKKGLARAAQFSWSRTNDRIHEVLGSVKI